MSDCPAFRYVLLPLLFLAIAFCANSQAQSACGDRTNCCDAAVVKDCAAANYQGSRVALVVGSDDYKIYGASLESLKNAQNDARTLGDVLRSQSFSVRYVFDPTPQDMMIELLDLSGYLNRSERNGVESREARALIYFAGHGVRYKGADYLLLRPGPKFDPAKIFESGRIATDNLSYIFAGLASYDVSFIFDACRSMAFLPGMEGTNDQRGTKTFETDHFSISTEHTVVRTTTENAPASDVPGTEPKSNGLYMKHLAGLIGRGEYSLIRSLELTARMVRTDQGSTQQARSLLTNGTKASGLMWFVRRPTTACTAIEPVLMDVLSYDCSRGPHEKGCRAALCRAWQTDGEKRSWADYGCLTPQMQRYLGNLETECPVESSALPSIGRTKLAMLNTTDEVRRVAVGLSPKVHQPNAIVDDIDMFTAKASDYNKLRGQLLKVQRAEKSVGVPLAYEEPFTFKVAPTLNAPDLDFKILQGKPRELRLDCVQTDCGSGWAAVTVQSMQGGALYRGFTPAWQLPNPAPGPQLRLSYEAGRSLPDEEKLAMLTPHLEQTIEKKGAVTITAIVGPDTNDKVLATPRLLRLELFMRNVKLKAGGLKEGTLVKSIIELEGGNIQPEVIVDFIIPPNL